MSKRQRVSLISYASMVDGTLKKKIDDAFKDIHVYTNLVFLKRNTRGHAELYNGKLPLMSMAVREKTVRDGFMEEFPHVKQRLSVYMITIMDYQVGPGGIHSMHALAAVKHGDNLYAFNPWGKAVYERGMGSVDDTCFVEVARLAGCKNTMAYKGANLQENDVNGACVGYSGNFAFEIASHIKNGNTPPLEKMTQNDYDSNISEALKSRSCLINRAKNATAASIYRELKPGGLNNSYVTGAPHPNRNTSVRKCTKRNECMNTGELDLAFQENALQKWIGGKITAGEFPVGTRNNAYKSYIDFVKMRNTVPPFNMSTFNSKLDAYN